jgi:hypothetical protein
MSKFTEYLEVVSKSKIDLDKDFFISDYEAIKSFLFKWTNENKLKITDVTDLTRGKFTFNISNPKTNKDLNIYTPFLQENPKDKFKDYNNKILNIKNFKDLNNILNMKYLIKLK